MPDLTTCLQTTYIEQSALPQVLLPSLQHSIFLQDCGELSLLTTLISPVVGMLWLGWDVFALGALRLQLHHWVFNVLYKPGSSLQAIWTRSW